MSFAAPQDAICGSQRMGPPPAATHMRKSRLNPASSHADVEAQQSSTSRSKPPASKPSASKRSSQVQPFSCSALLKFSQRMQTAPSPTGTSRRSVVSKGTSVQAPCARSKSVSSQTPKARPRSASPTLAKPVTARTTSGNCNSRGQAIKPSVAHTPIALCGKWQAPQREASLSAQVVALRQEVKAEPSSCKEHLQEPAPLPSSHTAISRCWASQMKRLLQEDEAERLSGCVGSKQKDEAAAARPDSVSTYIGAKPEDEVADPVQTRDSKKGVHTASVVQVPTLPLKALSLASCVSRETGNKTPTMTPHTLADIALQKSEVLLAELAALGLTSEDDNEAQVAYGNREPEPEDEHSNGKEDAFCLDTTPTSSLVLARQGRKHTDTVEVPVVLLDLLSETLSKYHSLVTSPQNKTKPESQIPIAKTHLADTASSGTSTTDDSTIWTGIRSLEGSFTSPTASSFSESGSKSLPLPGTSTFKAYGHAQPSSPSMRGQICNTAGRFGGHPSAAPANIQLHQPQVQVHAPVAASVRLEIPHGFRSCTIQQTFTVTSTVHLSFSVDV